MNYQVILYIPFERNYIIGFFEDYLIAEKIMGEYSEKNNIRDGEFLYIKEMFVETYESYHGINPIYNYHSEI